MDAARTNFQLKMDSLKMYMMYRRLPNALQNRITSFYDYQWDLLKGANEQEFLSELPKSLQQQVANFMSRDLIKTLPLLRKANNALLNALTDCVESNIYSPNDEILRPGEQVKGALLVSRGEVEVFSVFNKQRKLQRKLQKFDRFAEESLFLKTVSENLVMSKTFCEIFLLPSEDFMRIVTAQCDVGHINQMKETAEKQAGQNSKANKMFGSGDEAVPMAGFKKHCYPESKFRKLWGIVMFFGTLYYVFSISLALMFCVQDLRFEDKAMGVQLTLGYLVDAVFLVNLVLESTFFMYVEEGLVVYAQSRIRDNFFEHNSLPLEILSALPFDLLAFAVGQRYFNLLRATKVLRLSKFFRYADYAEKRLVDAQFGMGQAARRVIKLMFVMLAVCHWVGCFWYMMADLSDVVYGGGGDVGDGDNNNNNNMMWRGAGITTNQTNWRDADQSDALLDVLHSDMGGFAAYLRSIYWAIVALSTVGYGDIVPQNILETVFSTLAVLAGGLVLPAIVGGLAAYIGNLNQSSNIHKKKMYKVRTFMRTSRFPPELVDKILRYYDYLWSRQGGVDEVEIMSELPGPLQQRVAMVVSGASLSNIPFFEHCDEGMQQYLVSMLNPRVFLPKDTLVRSGEVGTEMFLIERGTVIISSDDKKISYAQIGDGDYFGETCLLAATTRMSTVYAVTYCDCFVLTKDDYGEVMSAYHPKERMGVSDEVAKQLQSKINKNRAVDRNFTDLPKCLQRTFNTKVDRDDDDDVSMSLVARIARIKPDSVFRHVWNFLILVVCSYNAVAVPFRLAFLSEVWSNSTMNYYYIDWVFDIFFIVDMYLNMYEFAYVFQGELVNNRDKVKKHYLSGNFKADLATTFPLDFVALLFISDTPSLILCLTITRIPKLIRLSRVVGTANDISLALEDTNVPLAPIQLTKLLVGLMLIGHLAACGFHAFANYRFDEEDCLDLQSLQDETFREVLDAANLTTCRREPPSRSDEDYFTEVGGVAECGNPLAFIKSLSTSGQYAEAFGDGGDGGWGAGDAYTYCKWGRTWVQKQIQEGKLDCIGGTPMERYLRAFNWALPTLVVVVIGDVVPITTGETLYAFLLMVLGVTINATIVGNVANLVANLETDESEFVKKADDIKHFMHMHHVDARLVDRVEKFMSYLWTAHGGATNEQQWGFIAELPHTLQMAVSDHTRLKYVKDCPFFDFCSSEILKALAMCLNPMVFSRGDVLVQFNDMGQEMYFLEKGAVEVVSGDGKTTFATLHQGSFFGETALFFKQKRSATVLAVEFCEVFQLEKRDLDNELRQREFDLSKMLGIFTAIADSNKRRNSAMRANLKKSKQEGTKLFKMIDSNDDNVRRHKKVRAIFLPNSKFRAYWDTCLMLWTVWFAISILWRIAFVLDEHVDAAFNWLVFDFAMDAMFIVDIYFNWTCFPYIQNGTVISETEKIRDHYLRGWMVMDILSCLPLEILALALSGMGKGVAKGVVIQLRLVHLLRIIHLPSYFSDVDHYLNLWNIRISAATSQLMMMFAYYIFLNHWCACIWFIIHRYAERNVETTWATADCPSSGDHDRGCLSEWDPTLGQHDICSEANGYTIMDCYTRAFFLVITTISTVGYGDIAPHTPIETIWENIVILLGACIFAGIIGCFTAFLSQNDTSGPNAFKLKMQKLQEYMKYRNLPLELQATILLHHKHRWNKSQIMNEKTVMEILPLPLQLDLSFAVVDTVIRNVPILNECSSIMQKRIAHAFTVQTCPPQSFIYEAGDIGWDIYFVGSGLIKIALPKNLNVLDLAGRAASGRAKRKAESIGNLYRIGNHFGESCLTSQSGVRQETAEARTMAELYLLPTDDMELVCSYMTAEGREKFLDGLMSRNGNVRHTFGDDEDEEERALLAELERSLDGSSPRRKSSLEKKAHELAHKSENGGLARQDKANPYQVKTIRRKTLGLAKPAKDLVRLRSFSAEASEEAIQSSDSDPTSPKLKKKTSNALVLGGMCIDEQAGAEHRVGGGADARTAISLIQQMADDGVDFDFKGGSDSDSDSSSRHGSSCIIEGGKEEEKKEEKKEEETKEEKEEKEEEEEEEEESKGLSAVDTAENGEARKIDVPPPNSYTPAVSMHPDASPPAAVPEGGTTAAMKGGGE